MNKRQLDVALSPIPVASSRPAAIKKIRSAFTKQECDELTQTAHASSRFYQDQAHDGKGAIRYVDVTEAQWAYEKLAVMLAEANVWNFALSDICDPLRIIRYGRGGFAGLHNDVEFGSQDYLAKITAIVPIVERSQRAGGDLYVGNRQTQVSLQRGDCVVFPSFALHEVTRVTRGTRLVLTAWASGPPWA